MARRNPNGYGGISKLKGKRSKPFMAYVSDIISEGVIVPPDVQNRLKTEKAALQQADTKEDIASAFANALCLLYDAEELKEKLSKELEKEIKKRTFKSKQVKKPIGYFKTQAEANIALAEYNKNPYDMDTRKITFKEVYDMAYKDARIDGKSKSAQNAYKSGFAKCEPIWNMPIAEIKLAHLQSIIDAYAGKSKSTQNTIIIVQHLAYTYAMKHDLAEKDYSSFVKMKDTKEGKEKKPFTREEIQLLWQNQDWKFGSTKKTMFDGLKVSEVLLLLIHTGIRIDEMLKLKKEDVHIAERYIKVNGTKTSNAVRLVPIHKDIIPILEERVASGNEYIITDANNEKIEYANFKQTAFKKFCKDIKLQHTIHETRHTFATFTTKMDSTLRSYIIGHSTNNLTNDVYTHPEVLLPELIAEIDKIAF